MTRAKLESISNEFHRRTNRIDPLFLSNVLFQNIVLKSSRNLLPVCALLLGYDQIHRQKNRRWRIDRLGDSDALQGNTIKQHFHISEGRYGDAALADITLG